MKLLVSRMAIKIALRDHNHELLLKKERPQYQISALSVRLSLKKGEVEAMYGYIPVAVPHPGCADCNNTKNS